MPFNRGRNHRAEKTKNRINFEKRWQNIPPDEQLKILDQRLGEGIGATKQRRKIQEKLRYIEETNQKILKLFNSKNKQKIQKNNKNNKNNK